MLDHITFSVITGGAGGDKIYFRMRPEQTANIMINTFCERQGISLSTGLRFISGSRTLDPLLSLQEQGVKDGSCVFVR